MLVEGDHEGGKKAVLMQLHRTKHNFISFFIWGKFERITCTAGNRKYLDFDPIKNGVLFRTRLVIFQTEMMSINL